MSLRGLPYEVVPGVSALGAAAAALGLELTTAPGQSPPLILVAPHDDAPAGQRVRDLAQHGATMALFMAGKRAHELQEELAVGGFTPETPCAIVNRASWPDECVVRCQLSDLAAALERPEFERQTLVLVGPALAPDPTPA